MEVIKKIFRERAGGLFLLVLAGVVMTGMALNSQAKSPVAQNLTDTNESINDEKILGEANDNSEEIANDSEGISQDTEENDKSIVQEEVKEEEKVDEDKAVAETEDNYYNDLKGRLKKYCEKNYSVKKCREYLIEAKDAFKKGARFKDLYKKYHFEKKKETRSSSTISGSTADNIKTTLAIKLDGSSKSYDIESARGISVLDLMRQGKISFDILNDGRIDNIGGEKKESGSMSWMLYACKNGICKMSPSGASEFKIDGYDKIEWRYLDWMTMGMDDWNTW